MKQFWKINSKPLFELVTSVVSHQYEPKCSLFGNFVVDIEHKIPSISMK